MTYRQLLEVLSSLSEEQLDNDVTIYDELEDEYYPADKTDNCKNGVLDDNHLFISFSR